MIVLRDNMKPCSPQVRSADGSDSNSIDFPEEETQERISSPKSMHRRRAKPGLMTLPQSKSVFVVDDDPSMLKGVQRLLRVHGFNTELFESAEAVCSRANMDDAFCVVLDINLNCKSGIELRDRLRSRGAALPVVYITGKDDEAIRKAAIESGCIAYLTKPFSAKDLIDPILRVSLSAH